MGTGIPFAIGAKLQDPARPVVVIAGDFAFGRHAFEMETAIRHNVPIVVIVANNDGNAGALRQRSMFPGDNAERVAMFQPGIGYHRIVEAFGGHGEHVVQAAGIGPALRRALACGAPACINVALDPDAPFPRQ
jgi:thiamine pyrophosphate-dependent acetolactate synthase large subunit-like protein